MLLKSTAVAANLCPLKEGEIWHQILCCVAGGFIRLIRNRTANVVTYILKKEYVIRKFIVKRCT